MDKRRRIPVKDVKQICYEAVMGTITKEKIRQAQKMLDGPQDPGFDELFDHWFEARVQLVIDRLDYKPPDTEVADTITDGFEKREQVTKHGYWEDKRWKGVKKLRKEGKMAESNDLVMEIRSDWGVD